jgi:hypothetical protein
MATFLTIVIAVALLSLVLYVWYCTENAETDFEYAVGMVGGVVGLVVGVLWEIIKGIGIFFLLICVLRSDD